MDYRSFHLIPLDESSASFLEIHPTYEFRETLREEITNNVSVGGQLNTYKVTGHSWEYSLPLVNVTSEDVNTMSVWWQEQRNLYLTINVSETNTQFVKVRIINQSYPFPVHTEKIWENFDGFLRLISTDGSDKSSFGGLPFLVGDAFWGLLDNDYNFLL